MLRQEANKAEQDDPEDPDLEAVKAITGLSAGMLFKLRKAELKVDCRGSHLHLLGQYCPQLVELKLSNSYISSLRDLGTTFYRLEVMWLVKTHLRELDGLSGFPSLKELYAAFNAVQNLSGVLLNNSLEVLDLEGNEIADMDELSYMSGCDSLYALTLEGNPISREVRYRERVFEVLPQLMTLDEMTREQATLEESLPEVEDSQVFLDSLIMKKYAVGLEEFINAIPSEPDEYEIVRASVKQRYNSKFTERSSRPKTAGSMPINIFMPEEDVSSHLTEEVFVGNPLKALRHKRERLFKPGDSGMADIFSLLKAFKTDEEREVKQGSSSSEEERPKIRIRARQVIKRTTPRVVGDFAES
jgi:Leucine-rich repeat (LRR) protein